MKIRILRTATALIITIILLIELYPTTLATHEGINVENTSSAEALEDLEEVSAFGLPQADIELEIVESEPIKRTEEETRLREALREAELNAGEFPYDCPVFVEARNAALVTSPHGYYDEYGVFRETAGPEAFREYNPSSRALIEPGYIYNIDGTMTAFVNTWSTTVGGRVGFYQAFQTPSVDKILMVGHIDTDFWTASRPTRANSIEIDGGGYTLRFDAGARLILLNPGVNNQQHFHIHNIFFGTHNLRPLDSFNYEWAIIAHNLMDEHWGNLTTPNWSFRLGNAATLPHNTRGNPELCFLQHTGESYIARIIRGNASELTIYGDVLLNTNSENFYIGKVLVEDGARYIGHTHLMQYSTIWFVGNGIGEAFPPASTAARPSTGHLTGIYGEDGNPLTDASFSFVVGKGAYVRLSGNGILGGLEKGFPMIYENYRRIVIGEDAHFSVSAHRTAGVGFSRNGQGFIANPGSFVNLTTNLTDTPVITTTSRGIRNALFTGGLIPGQPGGGVDTGAVNPDGVMGCYVIIQEGAELFVTGNNHSGVHYTYPDYFLQGYLVHNTNGGHANLGGIIHMPGGTLQHPNRFVMNRPKRFDLANTNDGRHGNQNAGPVFSQHPHFRVEFNHSDILLWETGGDINRNPDLIFLNEERFAFEGTNLNKYTSITNPRLQEVLRRPGAWASNNFNPNLSQDDRLNPNLSPSQRSGNLSMGLNNYRRISAINGDPFFRYDFTNSEHRGGITDADYIIHGHVLIGLLPLNEGIGNIDGGISWVPVYAGEGIGRVWMTDSHGVRFVPRLTDALGIDLPTPLPTDVAVAGATTSSTGAIKINTLDGDPGGERPFQRAHPGSQFISTIARIDMEGQWREASSPVMTRVFGVTPPAPAILTTVSNSPLIGAPSSVVPSTQPAVFETTAMVGGTVPTGVGYENMFGIVRRNGFVIDNPPLVIEDGTWTLDLAALSPKIAVDDIFDIILNDGVGALPSYQFHENNWEDEPILDGQGNPISWSLMANPLTRNASGNQNPIVGSPFIGAEPTGVISYRRAAANHPYASHDRDFRFQPALRFIIEFNPGTIYLQVPTHFNFGVHPVLSNEPVRMIAAESYTGEPLGVFDDRGNPLEWQVNVSILPGDDFKHSSGDTLQLQLRRNGTMFNIMPGDGSIPVYGKHTNTTDFYNIWDTWYEGESGDGLFLNVPQDSVRMGNYIGVLNWTLINGP